MAPPPFALKYRRSVDRDSAHEMSAARAAAAAAQAGCGDDDGLFRMDGTPNRTYRNGRRCDPATGSDRTPSAKRAPARRGDSMATAFGKSLARSLGTKAGNALVRGVLGNLFRNK